MGMGGGKKKFVRKIVKDSRRRKLRESWGFGAVCARFEYQIVPHPPPHTASVWYSVDFHSLYPANPQRRRRHVFLQNIFLGIKRSIEIRPARGMKFKSWRAPGKSRTKIQQYTYHSSVLKYFPKNKRSKVWPELVGWLSSCHPYKWLGKKGGGISAIWSNNFDQIPQKWNIRTCYVEDGLLTSPDPLFRNREIKLPKR